MQEVFLDVWRNAHRFVPERAKASTWILTLAHRRAIDIVRREERRRADALELAPEPVGTRPTRTRGCASSASACRAR